VALVGGGCVGSCCWCARHGARVGKNSIYKPYTPYIGGIIKAL